MGNREWIWRPAVTIMAALLGLAAITLGPASIVLLWQERTESQQRARTETQHLGVPVRDGPVTFVVHEVRCGSDDELTYGRRCEVTLGARNDGPEKVTVPGSAQRLRLAQGARHQPVSLDREPLGKLAPGESATAVLVFDLPPHTNVTHVEVHSGIYSPGQPVEVAGQFLPLLD